MPCGEEPESRVFTPNVDTAGVYWWRAIDSTTLQDSLHYLEFVAMNGITEIYLNVNNLSNVAGFGEATVQDAYFDETAMTMHIRPLQEFVRTAYAKGITIYALHGSSGELIIPTSPSRTSFNRRIFGIRVFNYISAQDEQIPGLQFNIEPHQHAEWRAEADRPVHDRPRRQLFMQQKMDFVIEMHDTLGDEFRIDWCMPFWWNVTSARPYMNVVGRNGAEMSLYQGLVLESNRVLVMAFRDNADNMYNIARHVVAFANAHDTPVVFLATVSESKAHARFYEAGKLEMYYQLNRMRDIVPKDFVQRNLLGVAIHHVFSWYELQYERT